MCVCGRGVSICEHELVCAFLSSDSRIPRVKSRQTERMWKQTGSFEGDILGLSDNAKQGECVVSVFLAHCPVPVIKELLSLHCKMPCQ